MKTRTHLGLGKDAPLGRAVERSGTLVAIPVLCGLHHITLGYNFRVGHLSASSEISSLFQLLANACIAASRVGS